MRKFLAIGAAAAIAAVSAVAMAGPASADPPHHHYYSAPGVGIAAGILGLWAGAAMANRYYSEPYYDGYYHDYYGGYRPYDSRGHVAACFRAYRSYDVRTDTYIGYDGRRHYCEL